MARILRFLVLATASTVALAQNVPSLDFSAVYSYVRLDAEPAAGLTTAALNGWQAAVKLNNTPRFGWVFDAGGNYGMRRMVPTEIQPRATEPADVRQYFLLIGPEFRLFSSERVTVNARALIGAGYENEMVFRLREPFTPPGGEPPLVSEFRVGGGKPLTSSVGGSVELAITRSVGWRAIQAEWLVTELGGSNSKNHLRISSGLVFRFNPK